jgi:N-acetylneuraminic acid mutarotase
MKYATLIITLFSFSLFAQDWEDLESLPESASTRHHPVNFAIGGYGYLVAGADVEYASLGDFFRYDPLSDTWTQMDDFPGVSRGFAYGVDTETKGYMGFGYYYNPDTGEEAYLDDMWEYDPETDTWTELASCPCTPRIHPAMVEVNGKIYVGLGGSEFGDLGDWWEYDIATDTWTEKADFPSSNRHHPYYFDIGDYAYVGMGHSGPNIFDDFYRYDPETDDWITLGDLPDQGRVAGTQFAYGGKGYFLSGQGETHTNLPTGEFWEYTPETDSWVALDPHPGGGRWAPGSFVIDGGAYFMCGEANTGNKRDLMRYQIEGFAGIESTSTEKLEIFPNPTQNQFQIGNLTAVQDIEIVDLNGAIVLKQQVQPGEIIDVSQVEKGVHFCRLFSGDGVKSEKLVIQ